MGENCEGEKPARKEGEWSGVTPRELTLHNLTDLETPGALAFNFTQNRQGRRRF